MSERIDKLKNQVRELYMQKNKARGDWADWLFENHVFEVAQKAKELANHVGADQELAEAGGMLHDIADAVMSRFDKNHSEECDKIAKEFLEASGFNKEEIDIVVHDALRYHSCRNGEKPKTLEGKCVATGDAVIHIATDFYDFGINAMLNEGESKEEVFNWSFPKIKRDFEDKIFFEDVREEVREQYAEKKKYIEDLIR